MAPHSGGEEAPPPPLAPPHEPEEAACFFASLPAPLARHVFSLLPPDARLCAAAVCRGWREALTERGAWASLDFSRCTRSVTDALLRVACARAGGSLTALDVSRCADVGHETLLRVLGENAAALATLRAVNADAGDDDTDSAPSDAAARCGLTADEANELLAAAPALRTLAASLDCAHVAQAVAALRGDASCGALTLAGLLGCRFRFDRAAPALNARSLAAALSAHGAAHGTLTALQVDSAHLREGAALEELVDACACSSSLRSLSLQGCTLPPSAAASLARALAPHGGGAGLAPHGGGAGLARLHVSGGGSLLADARGCAALCDALRSCDSSLVSLALRNVSLWEGQLAAAGAVLLSALTGHATLRVLDVSCNSCGSADARRAAGAALAALLAANAPALRELRASTCILRDAGLAPLLAALARNSHLRALDVSNNVPSAAFLRDEAPTLLRANGSLRRLAACGRGFDQPGSQPWADAAEALVAARAAARDDATDA
jgi:hypothetical protein